MKTAEQLQHIRETVYERLVARAARPDDFGLKEAKRSVMVCGGTGCTSSDSHKIVEAFHEALAGSDLAERVEIVRTGCFGLCELGPVVIVYPEGVFYNRVKVDDVREIVDAHLQNGKVVTRLIYKESLDEKGLKPLSQVGFFRKQQRIALRNCGLIDPASIDEYLAADGYKALEKAVTRMTPQDVIETIKQSGLRGRGGGGFPTGLKWELTAKPEADEKFVICNADEGDPGAFMDRSVLEGDPHSVLEAMALCGYAIGAKQGYIYVRAEYPIAVERLYTAIVKARDYGLLGNNLFGSGFDFDVEVRLGAGAFVCGEETALMNSIEGKRGMPRPKPPFPATEGLWGKPTVINNVETLANIPPIILNGADWFKQIGTEKSKGTKVFALGGNVVNTGLVEVPMGTTLREVIYEIGGGIPNDRPFKAVQTGGPSGGCLTADHLDQPIDFDTLTALGSMMGSGGMIVMDDTNCMVDVARFYLEFTRDESCGKCTPCRVGTKRLLELLEKITDGKGTPQDLDDLERLSIQIKNTSLCALGQTAPNPVLSTLNYFREEYEAHVTDKKCPAGVCRSMLTFSIIEELCRGCGLCARRCPADAISGQVRQPYTIDQNVCIKCGLCLESCKFNAIVKA